MSGRFNVYIYPFTAYFHSLRSLTFIKIKHPYTHVNTNEESSKKWLVQCNRKEIIVRSDYIDKLNFYVDQM